MTVEFDYDVCFSFAGEDRAYVESVANSMRAAGKRVFYDSFEVADLWGKDLYTHLDDIYRNKAEYCVIFASEHYARKLWTNHERKSAQARAFQQNKEYILPARFDDTEIPGLLPTTGFISLADYDPDTFACLLLRKLGQEKPLRHPQVATQPASVDATSNAQPWIKMKPLVGSQQTSVELYDLLMEATEVLVAELGEDRLPLTGNATDNELKHRIGIYDEAVMPLTRMLITGCAFGSSAEVHLWTQAIERIANANQRMGMFNDILRNLARYPVLVLMFGAGMAALHGRKYDTFRILMTDPIVKETFSTDYKPLAASIYTGAIFGINDTNPIFGTERLYVPVSEHLHGLLREPMSALVKNPDRYDKLFDKFELLLALVYADIEREDSISKTGEAPQRIWGPMGRFAYLFRYSSTTVFEDIKRDFESSEHDSWSPLKAGLFGGSIDRFRAVYDGIVSLVTRAGYV